MAPLERDLTNQNRRDPIQPDPGGDSFIAEIVEKRDFLRDSTTDECPRYNVTAYHPLPMTTEALVYCSTERHGSKSEPHNSECAS